MSSKKAAFNVAGNRPTNTVSRETRVCWCPVLFPVPEWHEWNDNESLMRLESRDYRGPCPKRPCGEGEHAGRRHLQIGFTAPAVILQGKFGNHLRSWCVQNRDAGPVGSLKQG